MAEQPSWTPGQRWVSENEPELGLGLLCEAAEGRVTVEFPAAGETRCYSMDGAPLRRVRFRPGDLVRLEQGGEREVLACREAEGLLVYDTEEGELEETELCPAMSFSKPEDRLLVSTVDPPALFDLRAEALQLRSATLRSPLHGLAGARMALVPHQLHIAAEVASRPRPRALLADEVGLGKTIEACLILHRLLLTGRARRVLVLVPEPLVHQWFVELLRRFNLSFSLFDEERCVAICQEDPQANPFLDSQWVLAATSFLAADETRAAQAIAGEWDLLVVDEAHHLAWKPEQASPAWTLVERLAAVTEGVLLLTATPGQLGPEGHFARLRLLDPERHADWDRHLAEQQELEIAADWLDRIEDGSAEPAELARFVSGRSRLEERVSDFASGADGAKERLMADWLDSFGPGRVMFRNTRARLGGFPGREASLIPLPPAAEDSEEDAVSSWLADWLRERPEGEKTLVIARSRERAEEIATSLTERHGLPAALFHEDLTLLQRDRQAAWFAENDGPTVLVCSEIGSEGRNFQFARHLVLADLPDDVDLLEQRIGRLDRIGRQGTIRIHVPYPRGGKEEIHARWLHEGLDAFEHPFPGAAEVRRELADALEAALDQARKLPALLKRTRQTRAAVEERLARGLDRLLERASFDPERGAALVKDIHRWDQDAAFEETAVRLFDHAGLHVEPLGPRRFFLRQGDLRSDRLPALPADGLSVTFDRRRALEREPEGFLTRDHPLVAAALDELLGSESGNASFAIWETAGSREILLEAWFVVETVLPRRLHAHRFLPPTPVRVVVDHQGAVREPLPSAAPLRAGDPTRLLRNDRFRREILPSMIERSRENAAELAAREITRTIRRMRAESRAALARLRELAELSDQVSEGEIERLENDAAALDEGLRQARPRLDALRLVWKGPVAS